MRTPDEILAQRFDDSDILLGDRLLAKGQPLVICGVGGTGKSRILLQIAACTSAGKPFGGLAVPRTGLRWVIFQTENSNRRLQRDLKALRTWLGEPAWGEFSNTVWIHTLETEDDGFVVLQDPAVREQIETILRKFNPDVVAFDPLGEFLEGNLNEDLAMREGLRLLSRVGKVGNPERAIVVIHHAGTGRAGIAKALGWDRSGFGRNSKVLHSWTRGQINVVPASEDTNQTVVFSCGKANNGAEFPPFAMVLSSAGIYELDPKFSITAWQRAIGSGRSKNPRLMDSVPKYLASPLSKKQLVQALMDDSGCGKSAAYKAVEGSVEQGDIKFDPASNLYHQTEVPF